MTPIQAEMISDIGRRRKRNEDAVSQHLPTQDDPQAAYGSIFALADGVGGSVAGEIASREAVREVVRAYYDETLSPGLSDSAEDMRARLSNAVQSANASLYRMAEANPDMRFMATTLVTAAFRNGAFAVASVGDSPAFLVRDGQIRKLTTDHTFAEMQFRAGRLTHDEAWLHPDRHKLVRALGRLDEIEVDVITEPVQIGDCLLLCSDGLTRYVLPGEMLFLLKTNPLNQAAPALVARANERGGSDNISLIAIQVLPDEIEVETSPGSDARVETSLSRPPRLRRLRRLGLALTATLTAVLGVIEIRGSAKRGAK